MAGRLDPLLTSDAELSQYVTLYRGDGSCFPIHKDDAAQIATAEPGHIPLRSIDGFIVTAVKVRDGSVYLPNCAYRGEEWREAVTLSINDQYTDEAIAQGR